MAAIIGFERYHHYIRRLFLLDEQGIPEKGFSQRLNELGARGVGSYRTLRDLTELFLVSRCGPAAIDEGFDASPLLAFDSPERRRIGEEIEERLRNYLHHGEFPYIERVVKAAYPWLGGHEGRGLDDRTVEATLSGDLIVGRSEVWRALLWRIIEAAAYSRVPILLTGESGTGKELLARLVSKVTRKAGNLRATGPDLVTLDCGTLVPELSGSEFFGHERGAFTGAHVARDGAFALSNGVTLLLDEIGEIPLHLQPQILRCIQEGAYKRLGSNVWQKSDFRLVSRQQFRLDLYYRIAGCIFQTPPLRELREDIIPITQHCPGRLLKRTAPDFDAQLSELLVHRNYPGNVRELYQLVQGITARYAGSGPVTAGDLPEEDRPVGSGFTRAWPNEAFKKSISEAVLLGTSLQEIKQATAQTAVQAAMHIESGQVKRAAKRLGITDRAIQRRRASGQWQRNAEGATEAADASFNVLEAAAGIWSRASSRSARPVGMQQA